MISVGATILQNVVDLFYLGIAFARRTAHHPGRAFA